MGREWTVIDLFCGAGGLSEGFRQAGFSVLAGQDIEAVCKETFEQTHPEAHFVHGPIEEIAVETLLEGVGLKPGELDVLVGGPPCQGYSVYNHHRGVNDPRSGLFNEYLRIVEALQPKWLVMENVTGIMSIANGDIVREIYGSMCRLGYRVDMKVLKAEEYGIPQERRRIFFVATRTEGCPILFPEPTHGLGLEPFVTVWDAISDLPTLENGQTLEGAGYGTKPRNSYQTLLRGNCKAVENHSAPRLSAVNLQRMRHIPPGGSWRDIPFELLPAGLKKARRSDHTKRYGRPDKKDLACTILTKCDVHWGAFIHPTQDRSFTVREAARLQSFPDVFTFHGSRTEQYVQVGNAVPPLLGKAIVRSVLKASTIEAGDGFSLR